MSSDCFRLINIRKFFFGSIFILISLFYSSVVKAETSTSIKISSLENSALLGIIDHKLTSLLSNKFWDFNTQEQIAFGLSRDSIRGQHLQFLPKLISKETIKAVFNLTKQFKDIPSTLFEELVGLFEKLTVQEAIETANAALFQNQIRTSSGSAGHFYKSIENKPSFVQFQYLSILKSIDSKKSGIVFELYSPDFVDVPFPTASPIVGMPWDAYGWKPRKEGKLDPFILRFKGQLRKEGLGWVMDSSVPVEVAITFTDDVPRLDIEKESLPVIGDIEKKIEQYTELAQKLFELLKIGASKTGELAKAGAGKVGELAKQVMGWIENLRKLGTSGTAPDDAIGIAEIISDEKPTKAEKTVSSNQVAGKVAGNSGQAVDGKTQGFLNGVQEITSKESAAALGNKKEEKQEEKQTQKKAEPVLCDVPADAESAPTRDKVILNEIAWMGTKKSANDEWIELKNISQNNVSLEGWQLLDKDRQIKIVFSETHPITTGNFFLLERTDDHSVPAVKADAVYSGALGNSDEVLYLFNQRCGLEDNVTTGSAWPAGDSESRRTMERSPDFSWHTYGGPENGGILGTPKKENSTKADNENSASSSVSAGQVPAPTVVAASQTNANTHVSQNNSAPVAYQKILISEIQVEGQSAKDEFIELYNPNGTAVNLEGWSLKKKTSGGTESNLVSASAFTGTIGAYGYFLIVPPPNSDGTPTYRGSAAPQLMYSGTTYSIAADNAAILYYPNGNVSDKVGWGAAKDFEGNAAQNPPTGKSIGRKPESGGLRNTSNNSQDFELQNPTPKVMNQTPLSPPQTSLQEQQQEEEQQQQSDTTPPTIPGTPAATTPTSDNTPTWTWNASTDSGGGLAAVPYTAQWSLDSTFAAGVYSATSSSNSYTHTVSLANGTWYFKVKAKDASNNESAFSSVGLIAVNVQQAPVPEEPALSPDTTPPQLVFNAIAATQTNALFFLSWSATDPNPVSASEALPSGINSYSMYYTTSPSADGVFLQYKDANNAWQDLPQGQANALTLTALQTSVSLWGRDGKAYTFFAVAKDGANNQSAIASVTTAVNLAKSVVINEIAWAGTKASSSDKWIELFNNTSAPVNLTGWRLKSSDSDGPDIALGEEEYSKSIASQGYYLIEITDDDSTTVLADLTASFGNEIFNSFCEVLYLYNAANEIVDQTTCKSDGAWPAGNASPTYISMERVNSQAIGSDPANWASNNLIKQNGKDASNVNLINGTPRQQNSVSGSNTEITDLRFSDASYEFSTITLTKLGSPYHTNIANFAVPAGKTLVIEPGVELGLRGGSSIISVDGTLQAVGTGANPITFDAYVPSGASSGFWCGMRFNASSVNSRVEYATIKNADSQTAGCGSGNPTFAVFANGSSMTLKNSAIVNGNAFKKIYLKNSNSVIDNVTVSGATGDGLSAAIYIEGGSPVVQNSAISESSIGVFATPSEVGATPVVSNNTFANNTYAVKLTSAFGSFSGNSASGNTYDGIFMEGALSSSSLALDTVSMQADGIPYIISSFTVDSGKTLTFLAGSMVKFLNGGELTVNGTLKALGTASNPVTFTRLSAPSFWKRIYFNSGTAGSVLEYANVEYGGTELSDYFGALYVRNQSGVVLNNVQIKNSDKSGIFLFNGNISGGQVIFSGNQYALFVQTGNCPAFTNATFANGQSVTHPSSVACSY